MYQAKWVDYRGRCPRCGNRPTLYLCDGSSLCLNCKLAWNTLPEDAPAQAESAAIAHGFFTDELRRMEVYRAAIAAGFFTDQLANEAVFLP